LNKWIEIKWSLHPLFLFVLIASFLTGYFLEMITLFVLVLVHELGHIVMAHAVGWKVSKVKLLPFGGVVEVDESTGSTAIEEIKVAIAGPLQNVWMACLAWGLGELGLWNYEWVEYLIQANIIIALFNLLPIYPLDGGKIVLACLSYMTSFYAALVWAARLSLISSLAMIIYAVSSISMESGLQLNLFVIGMFLLSTNWVHLRHIPYIFYRFILYRQKRISELERVGKAAYPLIVQGDESLLGVSKMLKREKLHLICIVDKPTLALKLYSEQQLIQYCLYGNNLNRAVGDLFLLK